MKKSDVLKFRHYKKFVCIDDRKVPSDLPNLKKGKIYQGELDTISIKIVINGLVWYYNQNRFAPVAQ